MKRLFSILLATLFCLAAVAEDVTLTKCRGVVGRQGWGDKRCPNVSVATQFTADETAQCTGGMLSTVRYYIANTNYLGSLEVWVKNNYSDEAKLASVDIDNPRVGWNEVTLPNPIQIEPDMPIALGYSYTASGGTAKPVAFSDVLTPGGIYLNLGAGFIDGSSSPAIYANLCIEGIVTGLDLEYDVNITSLTLDDNYYATGKTATAFIEYENRGRALSSLKFTLTTNGVPYDRSVNEALINGQKRTLGFTFTVPDDVDGAHDLSVAVTGIDGQPHAGRAASAIYGAVNYSYPRNVVIEEITGTWCGWCIRGVVGMEQMHSKYPDSFIGIAVHYNDAMQVNEYWTPIGYTSAPCCDVDRHPSMAMLGVTPYNFQVAYEKEAARRTFADFSLKAAIRDGMVEATTTASFDFNASQADLRMVYALIEDGVTGYPQKNYYAGGGNGQMGGYESRPSVISDMVFNEVARAIYPSYAGDKASLASQVVAGQSYTHSLSVPLPKNIKDATRLSLVAMLLDGVTGQIIQAHKLPLQADESSVATPVANAQDRWHTLHGESLNTAPQHPGIYIHNGRKVVIR